MRTILIASLLTAASALLSSNAIACSCLGIANPQQAAKGPSLSVAKVKLKSYENATHVATVSVEKVYKGKVSETEIKIQGGDGASCAAMIDPNKTEPWVAIVSAEQDGLYYTSGCSQSVLDFTADGKIDVYLSEKITLTEQEFSHFVNLETVPTVKGMSCEASVSRSYMNGGTTKGLDDIGFYENLTGTIDDPMSISFTKTFTAEGLENDYRMNAAASVFTGDPQYYFVDVNLTEPFYGISTYISQTLDITESDSLNYIGLSTYKDVNGKSQKDFGDKPYYGYESGARCGLNLSGPLVSVR